MLQKIYISIQLLISHLGLFSAIVLTVWLPGALFLAYIKTYTIPPDDAHRALLEEARVSNLIDIVFSPVYLGAIVDVLYRLKTGQSTHYSVSLLTGLRKCFKLYITRLIAGLIILAGLLLFILPGILFAVWYAFLDPIVVLEGKNHLAALKRSSQLTQGKRWQILSTIFLTYLLIYLSLAAFSLLLFGSLSWVGLQNHPIASIIYDCTASVLLVIPSIVLFLFYWDARKQLAP